MAFAGDMNALLTFAGDFCPFLNGKLSFPAFHGEVSFLTDFDLWMAKDTLLAALIGVLNFVVTMVAFFGVVFLDFFKGVLFRGETIDFFTGDTLLLLTILTFKGCLIGDGVVFLTVILVGGVTFCPFHGKVSFPFFGEVCVIF